MADEVKVDADVTEAELTPEQIAEAEELAGFQAAIEGKPLEVADEVKEEEKPEGESETKVEEAPTKEEEKKVVAELASITKAQFDDLLAQVGGLKELKDGLEKLRGDAFGKLGGLERLIKQAEKNEESGLDLALTDEDFKEVNEEVPMLTKPLQKLVTKILKEAKVKVPTVAPAIDIESIRAQFNAEAQAKIQESETRSYQRLQYVLLSSQHPEWESTKETPEFKSWLEAEDKLTPGYKNMYETSWEAREIGGVFTKFKAHIEAEKAKSAAPPAKKVVARTPSRNERLKEALLPKASSATPRPKGPQTEEEAFAAVG